MEPILAIIIGILYAGGLYLMMRRSLVKLLIGLGLLGQASNLLIITMGRITKGSPPLIGHGEHHLVEPYADPLPQALILTAIVIGFGVQAFAVVLIKRTYKWVGTDDIDQMTMSDALE